MDRTERLRLAMVLTLSMAAMGLLALALAWRVAAPDQVSLANLIAGTAALLVGIPVFAAALHGIAAPSLHGVTDCLVALATLGAWAEGDFFTAALLPAIMVVGHMLEERSLLGGRQAIAALTELTRTQATRVRADGAEEAVPSDSLRPGELIKLRAGERAPIDGVLRAGEASLDMAALTGESAPIEARPGTKILAGAINLDGNLLIEVVHTGGETTLGKIIALMREAEDAKPPVARVLEAFAQPYLGLILIVAAATWFASENAGNVLAVLVAACPCALVLATPATAVASMVAAVRHGILIKGAGFLENLATIDSLIFDKTGTLTSGKLFLAGLHPAAGATEAGLVRVAASLGACSNHPVSRAAAGILGRGEHVPVQDFVETGGFGVTGLIGGETAALGRPDFFARLGILVGAPPAHDGPVAGASVGGVFLGWLLFTDQPRPEAEAALAELRSLGLTRNMLLTGDSVASAARIAEKLGIATVHAGALPDEKFSRVKAEMQAGYRPAIIGDGINDALALKAGAVGIALAGTDVATAAADVVLLSGDLRRIATAIRLSRACRRVILQNVSLGLGWSCVLVAAAATGNLGAEGAITAALLHNLSTFLGMANAGRLLAFEDKRRGETATLLRNPS